MRLIVGAVLIAVVPGTIGWYSAATPWPRLGHTSATASPHARSDSVVHLGNMGVLISRPEGDVLVDALFGDGLPEYETAWPALRSALEAAAPPFDRVTLVLATHAHRDHFDAAAVKRFLRHAPRAIFVGPADAAAQLSDAPELRSRVFGLQRGSDLPAHPAVRGVTVLDLPHGRTVRPVTNLGYVVRADAKRVLHTGDAELTLEQWEGTAPASATQVDLAILPYWYASGEAPRSVVRDRLRPQRTLLTHVPLAATPETTNAAGVPLASLASRLTSALLSRERTVIRY